MQADVQGVAQNVSRLIEPTDDAAGWRWMVYQMADEIELCHAKLTAAGIPLPTPAERPSTPMIVGEDGRLRPRSRGEE